jgi:hypothetical protein
MKTIAIIFLALTISTQSVAQIFVGFPSNYHEDLTLSKFAFKKFNDYRKSINVGSWKWSDSSYTTAKRWNSTLAKNGLWGHSDAKLCSSEIIVSVNIDATQPLNYEAIVDSCLSQILNSSYHRGGFSAPLRTSSQKYAEVEWGPITLSKTLCDSGAVSAYILDYGHYKQVTIVIHTIVTFN